MRWIDLGCPIDLTYDPAKPQGASTGWALDDQRPTLTLALPKAVANAAFDRILVGMHDTGTGLDAATLSITADIAVNGTAAGENLAEHFKPLSPGVWELKLAQPVAELTKGTLTVSVKDKQGNTTRVERVFSVGPPRK